MKKLVSICFACMLLTCAAGAANVGTIDNGYPGDTEAQAQMLCDLGLFRGTENGFELEKPMTRAEAAVMLTRFLGAEQNALAGAHQHPFTDVPQWADPYVGWLYVSGLTKGISATAYGSEDNVTCDQYCILLARASTDDEAYWDIATREEVLACDRAGFTRGDSVSLSARLLSNYYFRDGDLSGISVAQKLIDRGVFTKEQLCSAAWNVLPRTYERYPLHGFNDNDYRLSCVIAGVPVLRNEQTNADPVETDSGHLYAESNRWNDQEEYVFYRLNPETLALTELLRSAPGSRIHILGYAGQTDYLLLSTLEAQYDTVYAVRRAGIENVLKLTADEADNALFSCLQGENGCVFQADENTFYRLDEDGVRILPIAEGDRLSAVLSCGLLLMENITPEYTVISGWTWDGQPAGSFAVENQYPVPDNLDAESLDYWCSQYAPKMLHDQNDLAWGTAGLYRVESGKLVQITDMPVYDCEIDSANGSYVVTTSAVDERPGYYGGGIYSLAGNEIKRIASDGTQTVLLSNQPAHGLTFSEITCADAGLVRVQYTYVMGMADYYQYEYAVEDGKLRAIVHEYGEGGFSGYTVEEQRREQQRLDNIGVGIGSK